MRALLAVVVLLLAACSTPLRPAEPMPAGEVRERMAHAAASRARLLRPPVAVGQAMPAVRAALWGRVDAVVVRVPGHVRETWTLEPGALADPAAGPVVLVFEDGVLASIATHVPAR